MLRRDARAENLPQKVRIAVTAAKLPLNALIIEGRRRLSIAIPRSVAAPIVPHVLFYTVLLLYPCTILMRVDPVPPGRHRS